MHLIIVILRDLLTLIGLWLAFFVVVMSCFVTLMWFHRRISGPAKDRRYQEF
jgi:hypothetical protein